MPEPSIVASYIIDSLLNLLNDELHGKKAAFGEAQKIRHLNKAVDAVWKVFKELHENYWLVSAPISLDAMNTDFTLPSDYAEMRMVEVTAPVDYAGMDVVRTSMTSPLFRTERQSFNAMTGIGSSDAAIAIPGQLNYDIYGPDSAGVQHV